MPAISFQRPPGGVPDDFLVVHHQDGAAARRRPDLLLLAWRFGRRRLFHGWKQHAKSRALSECAGDPNATAMPPHDSEDGGQPKSTPGEFGRKKRIEDPALGGLIHARTGVVDF